MLPNGLIVAGWLVSLVSLLSLRTGEWPCWALFLAVLLRMQLQTGLFILAHDSMHGVLWPACSRWNDTLGRICLALYAALPYSHCSANHRRHHQAPATAIDPDVPAGPRMGAARWYRNFMAGYLSWPQMLRLLASWAVLAGAFSSITPTAALNVLLFCTAPLLLSSLQLFTFGTYLPHRQQRQPGGADQPTSLALPPWLSLLACFHFGYHREHHDSPALAWHQLPAVRRRPAARLPIAP